MIELKLEENKNPLWYDDAYKITDLIIVLILFIIVLSQSFAINSNIDTVSLLKNIINHNIIYLLVIFYFAIIKTSFGKKHFDYLNCLLVIMYFISAITSGLAVIQIFSLNSLILCLLNVVIFCYLFHTFLRNTRIWKDFKLSRSPFNELSNDWYFLTIVILAVLLLAVNLIFANTLAGSIICLLDCIYLILFGRYIYLYRKYLDDKKINNNNEGNFDDYKEKLDNTIDDLTEKVDNFIKEQELDKKIDSVKDKITDMGEGLKESLKEQATKKMSNKDTKKVKSSENNKKVKGDK